MMKGSGTVTGGITVALTYRRVSSDEQQYGQSLEAQQADCLRYVQRMGWVPGGDLMDVMTGRRPDRPGYVALLAEARRLRKEGKAVAIVVSDLDRLGRKLGEQIRTRDEMRDLGVTTHFVRQGGELDDLNANILGAVAENESKKLGQRVGNVRRHVRSLGWHTPGRPAWGYLWREATPDERRMGAPARVYDLDHERAPLVQAVLESVANGSLTPRGAAVWVAGLTDEQRGGRQMTFQATRLLLSAAVYVARQEQPTDVPTLERPRCNWPALITDDTFRTIQAHLEARATVPSREGVRFLLTGFLRCPQCGSKMAGWHQLGRWYRYRCNGPQDGGHAADIRCNYVAMADQLDAAVLTGVRDLLSIVTTDRRIRKRLERAWTQLQAGAQEAGDGRRRVVRSLRTQITQAQARIDRAVTLLLENHLHPDDYARRREQEAATIAALERELTELSEPAGGGATLPSLSDLLRDVGDWSDALASFDIRTRRDILAALVEQVVPVRVSRGKYEAQINWTPLGQALRQLRDALAAA